jgi:hypothetical protein
MRFLLIVSALGLAISSVWWPITDSRLLAQARALRATKRYEAAGRLAERVMKTGCTSGFRRKGQVLLHENCLEGGDAAKRAANYEDAWDFYLWVVETPGNPEPTGCERPARKEMERLIETLRREARSKWTDPEADLESIWNDLRKLKQRAKESHLSTVVPSLTRDIFECRRRYAKKLIDGDRWEEGLNQLLGIVNDEEATETEVAEAYRGVPRAIACQRDQLVEARLYGDAFEKLEAARDRFRDRPTVARQIDALQDELEVRIFGMQLADRDTRPFDFFGNPPSVPGQAHMTHTNNGRSPLKLMFRGASDRDFVVPARRSETFDLEPGPYVLAVVGAGRTTLRPRRAPCNLASGDYITEWSEEAAAPGGPLDFAPLHIVPLGGAHDLPTRGTAPRRSPSRTHVVKPKTGDNLEISRAKPLPPP